jgi:cystathionine beta-lyase family protein involved in aluminum resistance
VIREFREALATFDVAHDVAAAAVEAAESVEHAWKKRDAAALAMTAKTMRAFASAGVTEAHLAGTTGYGYHDFGRETYEAIVAMLMDAQAALARPQLVSGTQAIVATLAALAPGGVLYSLTGPPYDTLRQALVDHPRATFRGSHRYVEVPWPARADEMRSAFGKAHAAIGDAPAVAFIQRSRGYSPRRSASIADIAQLVADFREVSPGTPIVVDNCYGEFVESLEPCAVGADVVVGSLIKNPGAGIAPSGAYAAGTTAVVELVAERVFAPSLGNAIGPTWDALRWLYAGLYRAPKAVAESLKVLDFAAALFSQLGFEVEPSAGAERTDIIQAIRLEGAENAIAFAAGLQRMLPVNARAVPEPGPVPGYADPVIMAGGAFISGSTIELSCDAPMRPPYYLYLQGGLDLAHGLIAVSSAASAVMRARRNA